MKLHRNLVFAAIDSLQLIFNEQKQADKVLKKTQNLKKAREALKKKALENAEKIFGNVGRS